nr:MAG TPA: hypothetical protein [Caudoviricetes sp.]
MEIEQRTAAVEEEALYQLFKLNKDGCGYGDVHVLFSPVPVVIQKTFEQIRKEGKGLEVFTFKEIYRREVETALRLAGLYSLVKTGKVSYHFNYMASCVYLRAEDITDGQLEDVQNLLGCFSIVSD